MGKSPMLRDSEEALLASKGYRLMKKLGEGSYAPVFLTEYLGETEKSKTNKKEEPTNLACKVIDAKNAPKDYVKKFLPRELAILSMVNHPHIVHVHSIFQRKSKYFIFMRMAENGDLLDYILEHGPVSEARSRLWFRQISLAVQYLHELGVAHRDLKCENCLISANNNLKLTDFGFSRFIIDMRGRCKASSTYCGSLSYAAPEVLKGNPYYPKMSDCWSLGVILFTMLNKALPFDEKKVRELLEHQLNGKWKFRSKVDEVVSENVHYVVECLLNPDPVKRWTATQIVESDWIKMDQRLAHLTADEQYCLNQAKTNGLVFMQEARTQIRRASRIEKSDRLMRIEKRDSIAPKPKEEEEVTMFKESDPADGKYSSSLKNSRVYRD
nr:testis-specific serine/threonine-protein kinase 3-like [Leptinotarsa decemlineata]